MLSPDEIRTLKLMSLAGLSGSNTDMIDLFELLSQLDETHKGQFWGWLRKHDELLQSRLKRAKQHLDAMPPKPKSPWFAERLRRARGA